MPSVALFPIILFIFFTIYYQSNARSSNPTWITNSLIQSGTKIIVQANTYQQSVHQGPYIVTYSPAFTSSPWTALGLISMATNNPNPLQIKFKINIDDYQNLNQMKIKMVYADLISIQTFKVSYIAVDSSVSYLKVDYIQRPSLINVTTSSGARQYTGIKTLAFTLNASNTISVIPLLVGLNATTTDNIYILNWSTTLQSQNEVYFQLKVNGNTKVTQIISYILTFDRTAAQNTKQIFLDQIYITISNGSFTPISLVASNPSNFHAGLNSFQITQFMFDFDKTSLTLNSPSNDYVNISGWNFRKRQCSATQPYYDVNTNKCYDICPNISTGVIVSSVKYCRPCGQLLNKCTECSSSSVCLTCSVPWTVGSSNQCQCPAGKFIDSSGQCVDCQVNCTQCSTISTNCTKCDQYLRTLISFKCECIYGLDAAGECNNQCSYACTSCPNDTTICQSCKATFDLVSGRCKCPDHYYLNTTSQSCQICHNLCVICTGPTANQCSTCNSTLNRVFNSTTTSCQCNIPVYQQINGTCEKVTVTNGGNNITCPVGYYLDVTCVQTCGDGKLFQLQCDDGNLRDGDGCSKQCKIQQLFKCLPANATTRSVCSFDGFIIFQVIECLKDVHSNKLSIKYSVQPYLYFMSDYANYAPFLSFNFQFVSINSATFDNSTKILNVQLAYSQNLHQKQLQLIFTPPASSQTFAIRVSKKTWKVAPTNNLAALKYDDLIYQNVKIADYIATGAYISALAISSISLFFRKVIGLQLISMFQVSFLTFALLDYAQPLLGVITNWKFIFGYNQWYLGQPQSLPQYSRFQLLNYKTLFGYSVNVMLYANATIYVGSILCFFISLCTSKSTSRKFKEVAKFFPRQIAFGLIFFQTMNILIAIGIEAYYGNILNFDEIWSKVYEIIAILLLLCHFFGFLCAYENNIDSYSFYKKDSNFSKLHPILLLLRNGLLAGWLFLSLFVNQSLYVMMAIQGGYIIIMIIFRPYKKIIDFIRSIVIEAGIGFILVSRFIQGNYVDINVTNDQWGKFFGLSAYIEYGFFIAGIILSAGSLIYHICRIGKDKQKRVNPDNQENQSDFSQLENEVRGNLNKQNNLNFQKSKQIGNSTTFDFEQGSGLSTQYLRGSTKRKIIQSSGYF